MQESSDDREKEQLREEKLLLMQMEKQLRGEKLLLMEEKLLLLKKEQLLTGVCLNN
jgi:hypothetical protein